MKYMKYKLAIFDMDGTVLFTLQDLRDTMNAALEMHHMPVRTTEEVKAFVGNGIHKLVERAVPVGTSETEIEEVFKDFNEYYKDHCNDHTCPYDGILILLEHLKKAGIRCAVLSNKADYAVQQLDEKYFQGLIDLGVGEKAGIRRKPAPDMVENVLEQLGVKKEEAVYIGDSEVDVMTGKNAGMDVISVLWGYRTREQLIEAGAVVLVKDTEELESVLLK